MATLCQKPIQSINRNNLDDSTFKEKNICRTKQAVLKVKRYFFVDNLWHLRYDFGMQTYFFV